MKKDDAFIQSQVEDALKNARLLRTTDIRMETRDGEVTLFGLVDVLAEKWKAGEIVQQIPGVVSVDNSLTVAIDNQPEDNEIARLIQEKIEADPRADLHQISITVKEGVAYLQGQVGTIAVEKTAKELAARAQGVKEVVSYLKAGGGDFEIDDATIVNAIETALSRNAAVSARDIDSRADNGTVTLKGTVDTPDQIEVAERTVAQVPGVRKIYNNLKSRDGTEDMDFQLTNEIRLELGKNGLGGVKCFVVDGTVFLDGAVGTPDQKHRAEEIVSQFDGISGVNVDIQIS